MARPKHDLSRRETDARFPCLRCGGKFFTPQGRANHRCKKGVACAAVPPPPAPHPLSGGERFYKGKIVGPAAEQENAAAGPPGRAETLGVRLSRPVFAQFSFGGSPAQGSGKQCPKMGIGSCTQATADTSSLWPACRSQGSDARRRLRLAPCPSPLWPAAPPAKSTAACCAEACPQPCRIRKTPRKALRTRIRVSQHHNGRTRSKS